MTIRDYLQSVGRRVRYGHRRPIVRAVGFGFGPFADVTLTDKAGNRVAFFRVRFNPKPGWLSKGETDERDSRRRRRRRHH